MRYQTNYTTEQLKRACPSIFADDNKQTLSDKYLQIPTYRILDKMLDNGFKIVGAKEQRTRTTQQGNHAKHVVFLGHDSIDALTVGEGYPMIRVENSHNGLSSFQLNTGYYRLACSNGLIMPQSVLSSAKIRHMKGMESDVIEASYKIVTGMPDQVRMINEMKTIDLSRDEKMILAESARNIVFDQEIIDLNNKHRIDITSKLLTARRYDDRKNDLWSTFNTIQENAIKGGVRVLRESGFRRTKQVTGIDADKKINIELMSLAQKMMELKLGMTA